MEELLLQDGKELNLIIEPGYQMCHLQKFVRNCCLLTKCPYINSPEANNVRLICEELEKILQDNLKFEEVIAMYVASSMTFFIGERTQNFEYRLHLLHKTFRFANTLHPVHIHIATKYLYNELKCVDIPNCSFNILKVCQHISIASDTGMAINLCLLWAMLHDITGTKIEMFCFHELSHINVLLKNVVSNMIKDDENAPKVFLIVQIVDSLINTIVFGDNSSITDAGYKKYFQYSFDVLQKIIDWAEEEFKKIKFMPKTSPNWHLWIVIVELVKLSIKAQLNSKLQHNLEKNMID